MGTNKSQRETRSLTATCTNCYLAFNGVHLFYFWGLIKKTKQVHSMFRVLRLSDVILRLMSRKLVDTL